MIKPLRNDHNVLYAMCQAYILLDNSGVYWTIHWMELCHK